MYFWEPTRRQAIIQTKADPVTMLHILNVSRDFRPKRPLTSNLPKSRLPITYFADAQSF